MQVLAQAAHSRLPLQVPAKTYVWHGSPTATETQEKKNSSVLLRGQTSRGQTHEAYELSFQQPIISTDFNDAVVLSIDSKPGWTFVAVADLSGVQTNFMQRGEPQFTNLVQMSSPAITTTITEGNSLVASAVPVKPVTSAVSDWFDQMTARIRRFPKLQPDWDSYGGRTISQLTTTKALRVASHLAMALHWLSPIKAFVSPTHSGGVLFEVRNGNRELLLEIIPDKSEYELSQITVLQSGDEELNESKVNESHLPEVLNWIAGKN